MQQSIVSHPISYTYDGLVMYHLSHYILTGNNDCIIVNHYDWTFRFNSGTLGDIDAKFDRTWFINYL